MPTSNRKPKSRKHEEAPPTRKVITFVRLRRWYIPYDKETYRTLRRLNLACVRYHEDFVETLQLVTRPRGIRAKCIDFSIVYREFLHKLRTAWVKNPKRKISVAQGSICLESKDLSRVKAIFPEVESRIRKFFARWGFKGEFVFSEAPTKAKLQITFALDPKREPTIEFLDD